jgi:hypothetical protein
MIEGLPVVRSRGSPRPWLRAADNHGYRRLLGRDGRRSKASSPVGWSGARAPVRNSEKNFLGMSPARHRRRSVREIASHTAAARSRGAAAGHRGMGATLTSTAAEPPPFDYVGLLWTAANRRRTAASKHHPISFNGLRVTVANRRNHPPERYFAGTGLVRRAMRVRKSPFRPYSTFMMSRWANSACMARLKSALPYRSRSGRYANSRGAKLPALLFEDTGCPSANVLSRRSRKTRSQVRRSVDPFTADTAMTCLRAEPALRCCPCRCEKSIATVHGTDARQL